MIKIVTLFIALFISTKTLAQDKYLPSYQHYDQTHRGYNQYQTPELWHTRQYVLTFDDGPHLTRTPAILDLLKKYNFKATFYVVASRINQQTKPIIKRMIQEGHIVANHTWRHDNVNSLNETQFINDLTHSFKAINAVYQEMNQELPYFYFRFPYAHYGTRNDYHHLNSLRNLSYNLLGKNCIHFTFWDLDSGDWIPSITSTEIARNIESDLNGGEFYSYKLVDGKIIKIKSYNNNPKAGGIILFHDIHQKTVDALAEIFIFFKINDINIIHLGETETNSWHDFNGCQL
jgi:peptidoglycan/xylan/chitin deacetylase (PgdA/CDA1 family)